MRVTTIFGSLQIQPPVVAGHKSSLRSCSNRYQLISPWDLQWSARFIMLELRHPSFMRPLLHCAERTFTSSFQSWNPDLFHMAYGQTNCKTIHIGLCFYGFYASCFQLYS